MPQIIPILWLLTFTICILMFIITITFTYFLPTKYTSSSYHNLIKSTNKNIYKHWKWVWFIT